MAKNDGGVDVEGKRDGDTGNTKSVGKGEKAEKGDAHREFRHHEGQTRGRTMHNERSGSDSNAGSKNEGSGN